MKRHVVSAILLMMILGAGCAIAGSGAGAIIYSFNTSARYEGMGGAGGGSPWGDATNHWANPAQLAYRRGVQWEWFKSELAQGLADDIVLENNEFIIGFGGVSLLWSRTPASGRYLDRGVQQAVDASGQPIGTFSSYMKSESYGFALDVVKVFDFFQSKYGEPLNYSRYASLSFGYVHKDFEDMLAPDWAIQDPAGGGGATAKTHDIGWVVGITPVNSLDTDGSLGFLLGAGYGASTLNGGDEVITHVDADQSDPLPRAYVKAWSLHGEMAFGKEQWRSDMPEFLRSLYDTFNPLLSLTYAYQKSEVGYFWDAAVETYNYRRDTSGDQDEIGDGWELGLANILYVRRGHFEALYGDINEDTEGWGINLQAGGMFGFRYDKATVPQATGLPTVDRETWSIWLDPLAFCSECR
jgi:hypothetical protein